jgi:hypothetical protein
MRNASWAVIPRSIGMVVQTSVYKAAGPALQPKGPLPRGDAS